MDINEKIKQVFSAFKVDQVWTDEQDVYLTEKADCRKVTRMEFSNQSKTKK